MNNVGMILFFISVIGFIFSFVFGERTAVIFVKDRRNNVSFLPYKNKTILPLIGIVISFTLLMFSILMWNNASFDAGVIAKALCGGLFFSSSLYLATISFTIHFYGKNLDPKLDKILYFTLVASCVILIISFLYGVDAFSCLAGPDYLLPNGINFSKGLVYPNDANSPQIAFYAICILLGAVFVYLLCDHKHYRKYGKHGMLDSTFLIAFPSGILGARITYVIGEWDKYASRIASGQWWSIFAIWEGGLTILGGAILGIIVGVLWYRHANKGKSIFWAVDAIVPTILIAQAIGRWGNFFNCEVHGELVNSSYFSWLPNFITNNARYSSTATIGGSHFAPDGMIWAPLFFIEALVNVAGYFVLSYIFGKKLSKFTKPGDLAFGYIVWYGYTRVFMEPLRNASFNMGKNGYWSWVWSLLFVLIGALLIMINHIVRTIKENKNHDVIINKKTNMVGLICFTGLATICLIVGIVLMSSNANEGTIAFNGFNIGIILLVSGLSLLTISVLPVLNLFLKRKEISREQI